MLPDPMTLVTRLRDKMCNITAVPVQLQPQRNIHVGNDLTSCTHVFIHHDAVCKPLQQPYVGPYRVLARADKHFKIDINGRHDMVSLDHLKPAHMAPMNPLPGQELLPVPLTLPPHSSPPPSPSSPPPVRSIRTTRSGLCVNFPE